MTPRLTLFYFLSPRLYIDDDFNWTDFDMRRWSEQEYDWQQDDWNGLKDTVQRPTDTLRTGRGDCDDYSLVALSWLDSTTDHRLYLSILYSLSHRQGHMVTYDATDETVYSSGEVLDMTLDEYELQSPYSWRMDRKI